ncbi:MAG: sigma-70 family RNA polymerase sigma factor [Balneolaceae bacterium]
MLAKINKPKSWSNHQNGDDWNKLWEESRTGNSESLSKIFCYTYSQMFNYGYKIVQDEDIVKDCIQELFMNLWYNRNEVSEAHSVKSYLLSSLRRIIFRRLKKQINRTKRNYEYSRDMFAEMYNVEELMIHFETKEKQKQQLLEALQALSKRQKEAVYLKFFNGLSNSEISEVMELNKQSVYNHISKAIQKMQDFIQV